MAAILLFTCRSDQNNQNNNVFYSEVLIIRPTLALVESGLNSEQVSLIRKKSFYITKTVNLLQ